MKTEPKAPGLTTRERRALAAVAAQFWINGMVYGAVVPRFPDLRDQLSISIATLGVMLTFAATGGLIGSAVVGRAIDRHGTKRCVIAGTIVMISALPIIGLTRSVAVVAVVLTVMAANDVVVDIGMNMQASHLSAKRRVPVMNRLHGLWSLGSVIGGLVAVQMAASGVSITAHLTVVAVVLALALAGFAWFLLPGDEPSPAEASDTTPSSSAGRAPNGPTPRPLGSPRSYPLLIGLLAGAAIVLEMTTSDWAAFRLADDLGVRPGLVGLGFVGFTSGMVVGRFAGDAVQAMVGPRLLVRYAAALALVGLGIATLVPSGIGPVDVAAVSVAGFFIAALGVSVLFPQLYDAAAKAPGPPGRGLAALTAGTRIAGLAAPVVVGFVAGTSLSVGVAMAIVTIPCGLLTMMVPLSGGSRAT